jgi:hypothetical protein
VRPGRRVAEPPFESTSRWLRGRILDWLRDAPDGTWVDVGGAEISGHDAAAVEAALTALARERLVELRPGAPAVARLPLA